MSEAGEDAEVRGILEAGTAAAGAEPLRKSACALSVVAVLKDPPVDGATGAVIQPIIEARPVPKRRQRRPNRVRPDDHSLQAACDSELAAAFLHAIQKKFYHMCTRKQCPQGCAKDLFAVMTAHLHACVCNDAQDKRSHVTYTVTLSRGAQVEELCAFHLRWDHAWANLRLTRGGCLSLIPPPVVLQWKASRGRRPYVSDLYLVATVFRINPVLQLLSSGTDLETTDVLEHAVVKGAKQAVRRWSASPCTAVPQVWCTWANKRTIQPMTQNGLPVWTEGDS